MEITKQEFIDAVKEDLIENICESFYEWLFEEDSDIQQLFSERIVKRLLPKLEEEYSTHLKNKISYLIVDDIITNNGYEIKEGIISKVSAKLLETIKLEVKICEK